jgi:hypothetical protein
VPPTTKVASQREGQGSAPGDSQRVCLELGRTNSRGRADKEAGSLREDMSTACDASMPRSVFGGRHNRCVLWWTPEIVET